MHEWRVYRRSETQLTDADERGVLNYRLDGPGRADNGWIAAGIGVLMAIVGWYCG